MCNERVIDTHNAYYLVNVVFEKIYFNRISSLEMANLSKELHQENNYSFIAS
jgi:hypothetical protein